MYKASSQRVTGLGPLEGDEGGPPLLPLRTHGCASVAETRSFATQVSEAGCVSSIPVAQLSELKLPLMVIVLPGFRFCRRGKGEGSEGILTQKMGACMQKPSFFLPLAPETHCLWVTDYNLNDCLLRGPTGEQSPQGHAQACAHPHAHVVKGGEKRTNWTVAASMSGVSLW